MPAKKTTVPRPRFEIFKGKDGIYARSIARNGKEVWRTSEGYARVRSAITAIKTLGSKHPVLDLTKKVKVS